MKRRRLTVWLVFLVAAHGARTADPQNPNDVTSTSTSVTEPRGDKKFGDKCELDWDCGFDHSFCDERKRCQCRPEFPVTNNIDKCEPVTVPRGEKKFGDKCELDWECGFDNSICDKHKKCQCRPEFPATNHIDKCGPEVRINESCFFNEQCEIFLDQTECRDSRCVCRFELNALENKQTGRWECLAPLETTESERYMDPAMIMILVAMALMFIIICVVLHLFSKARWRENRTIFNTPNPRLMNVSLLRDNKHTGERRGSRGSVRAPSRQPSMASLRPQSPNASQGSRPSRCGSRGSSTSSRSPTKMAITNNITLVASKLADGESNA